MAAAHRRGCEFILLSPVRDDLPEECGAEWVPLVPGTDTALMLGMAHSLLSEGLHDAAFIERYCTGWADFEAYLTGRADACPRPPNGAGICASAERIAALARRMPAGAR